MATWKKVIVSGSIAELNTVSASAYTVIGATNQVLSTPSTTVISGSFSGSFQGDLTSVLPAAGQPNFVAYNVATGKFSYAGTGSFSAATASYVSSSNVFGPFGSNSILTASFATTASFVQSAVSSSFATTASFASTASFVQNAVSSSFATTASFASTASFVLNAVSASFASTASFVQNAVSASFASTASFVQNAVSASFASTASLAFQANNATSASFAATASSADNFAVRGTITAQTLIVQTITSSQEFVTGSTKFGSITTNTHQFTGSVTISGSLNVNGPATLNNLTGSLFGTASFANNATSASFATTASFWSGSVTNALSASFASTASFVQNAVSASFAATASSVNTLNQAVIISGSLNVAPSGITELQVLSTGVRFGNVVTDAHTVTGSFSVSGSVTATNFTGSLFGTASLASNAVSSSFASTASFVQNAVSSSFASTASFVQNAVSASFASTASFVQTAASVANALTFGTGLSGSVATYNGSAAVNVAVSGSATLSTNNLPKWTGTGFTNSNVVDTGTQVQIGVGASSGVNVAAGGINVTGNSTFNNNLTIAGDLVVNGTASFVNSTNLYVKDQFITINSGSSTLADSGIVAQYNAAGSGSAFLLEAASAGTYGRWAVAYDVIGTSTTVAADEFVVTAKINQASNPSAAPTWGSTTNGSGNIWVTNAGDIFIYA